MPERFDGGGDLMSGTNPRGLIPAAARPFIAAAFFLFIAGLAAGYLNAQRFDFLEEVFEMLAERFSGRSTPMLAVMLFLNNLTASAVSIALGVAFGVMPALSSFINGALIGVVIKSVPQAELLKGLLLLVPHGVFEFPAMMVSWGLGLYLGAWPLRRDKAEGFKERALAVAGVFARLIVPLLIVAAAIEASSIYFASR